MASIFQKIIDFFKREKEEILTYPPEFLIIDYSLVAKQHGVTGDENKIIYRYSSDEFGNATTRKYSYSKQRLKALIEVYKIPYWIAVELSKIGYCCYTIKPEDLGK